jgi:predicted ATPase
MDSRTMDAAFSAGVAEHLETMFARLVELPADERRRRLDADCEDPALRRQLEALLGADARADEVMDALGIQIASWMAASTSPDRTDSPRRLPPGIEISHYRVLAPVGEGGMGVVVRARDLRLDRDVALKFLPPAYVRSADAKRRLLREARAAAALDHPNICTVYDIGDDAGGGLFIAMAYCEGETLASRLRRGPLEVSEALAVVQQMCDGLAAAHAAGICHCDVKPSNVILTTTGTVKLVDFGIARAPAEHTGQGMLRGTLTYMAPEQLQDQAVDARADVWAIGVVLLECLSGRNPFRAETDAVTLYRILNGVSPALPPGMQLRDELQALLARCLAKRPEERFADADPLRQAIRRLRESGSGQAAILGAAPGRRPAPVVPTRLIGREHDLRALDEALRSARLVTVTGTAGTGKTRLVLDAVKYVEACFRDGTWFVSLAVVTDPGLVASKIASELGLIDEPTRAATDLLCEHIGEREILLVLDNFEQVVAAASLLSNLLARCSRLTLLVTSRVALRLRGEQEFPLAPLPLPPDGAAQGCDELVEYPATALFLERARAIRPELAVDREAALAIASICRHLDGLPLAIELAAAQVRLFSPTALLERLGQRLDALAGGARDLPQRHRTLRDAIAWSYRLLGAEERKVFRWAGVFAGGADLEALEQIGAAALDGSDALPVINTLAEHSLLRPIRDSGGRARLTMLETIREYALERLSAEDDESAVRLLHAEHHMQLAETGAQALSGPDQATWLYRLEQEHDNLRAALNWAEANGEAEIALRIGAALCRFWTARGHVREGLERLNRLRRMEAGVHLRLRRGAVLAGAGSLVHETGDFQGAQPLLEEALTLFREAGDEASEAALLNALAWTHAHTGPLDRADRIAQDALEVCRRRGDQRGSAVALHNLSWIAVYRGLPRRAISFADASIEIRQRLGDQRRAAFTLANRSRAERQTGEFAAAHATLAVAMKTAQELDDRQLLGLIRMAAGQVQLGEGDAESAARSLQEALDLWQNVRHEFAAGDCLNWLAAAEIEIGRPENASALLIRAAEIWERIGGPWGRAATLFRQGQLARHTGQPAARKLLERSLELRRAIGDLLGEAESLEELARVASDDPSAPVELLARAAELRRQLGVPPARMPVENLPR